MPKKISQPTVIAAAGNKPKEIREYVGRVNTDDAGVSVAHMRSPQGWVEPGQRPEFREITLVLKGKLKVETEGESFEIAEGESIITEPGEWVRYSTPDAATEYVAVCLPAFSPDTVNRDAD